MILGFAHFRKQSRKLKQNFKKQSRKSNEINMNKSLNNHLTNHEKTIQKTTCFLTTPKIMFFRIFGGVHGPTQAQKYDFGPICDFSGVPKSLQKITFGVQKSAKGAVAFLEQFRLIGTGADLVPTGCDLASIWLQGRFFYSILGWFWVDFGSFLGLILEEFSMKFGTNLERKFNVFYICLERFH